MDDAFLDSALRLGRDVDAGARSLADALRGLRRSARAEAPSAQAVLRLFREAFVAGAGSPTLGLVLGELAAEATRALELAEIDLEGDLGRVDARLLAWFLRAWLALDAGRPDLAEEGMDAALAGSASARDRVDAALLVAAGWERARSFAAAANAYFAAAQEVGRIFDPARLAAAGVLSAARAALRDVRELPEVGANDGAPAVLHAVLLTRAAQCCVLADDAAAAVRLAWQAAALLKAGAPENAAGIERRVALNTLSVAQAKAGALDEAAAAAEESFALAEAAGDRRSQIDAAGLVARHHAQRGDEAGARAWVERGQATRRALGARVGAATERRVRMPMRYILSLTARDLSICLVGLVDPAAGGGGAGTAALAGLAVEVAQALRTFADRGAAQHERWQRGEAEGGAREVEALDFIELARQLAAMTAAPAGQRAIEAEALAHPEARALAWALAIWIGVAVELIAELSELERAAWAAVVDGGAAPGWGAAILEAAGLRAKLCALPVKASAATEGEAAEALGKDLGGLFTVYAMKALEAAKGAAGQGAALAGDLPLDAADLVQLALGCQTRRFAGVYVSRRAADAVAVTTALGERASRRVDVRARAAAEATERQRRWRDLGASAALHAFVTGAADEGEVAAKELAAWGILRALGRDGGGADRIYRVAAAPLPAWVAASREPARAWIEAALREVAELEAALVDSLRVEPGVAAANEAYAGAGASGPPRGA
ncbi:MAG: hypothetical protein R3A79_05080 [Nannocystaceae bacterium]